MPDICTCAREGELMRKKSFLVLPLMCSLKYSKIYKSLTMMKMENKEI